MARFAIDQMVKLQNMPPEHSRLEGRMVRVKSTSRGLYVVVPFAKLSGDTADRYEVEENQLQAI